MKHGLALLLSLCCSIAAAQGATQRSELQRLVDAATPGSTLRLEGRVYPANIIVNKPLTIVGQAGTVLQGDNTSNVVRITAPHVTLSTLTIRGSGKDRNTSEEQAGVRVMAPSSTLKDLTLGDNYHGLHLNSSAEGATVQGCRITGLKVASEGAQGNGITIIRSSHHRLLNNTISGTRDGIFFEYSSHDEIRGNRISRVRYGLHYMYSNDNVFTGNSFSGNMGGAAIMHSERLRLEDNEFSFNQGSRSFGLILQGSRNILVRKNAFHLNERGLYIQQTTASRIEDNTFFRNGVGVELWSDSASQVFTRNTFDRNTADAVLVGGESNNQWYQNGEGNYWNKPALDLDQNGIADTPLKYQSALGHLIEQNELAYLFISSPALGLYERANQLFWHGDSVITDNYPLLRPVSRPSPLWVLVGVGLAGLFVGGRWLRQSRSLAVEKSKEGGTRRLLEGHRFVLAGLACWVAPSPLPALRASLSFGAVPVPSPTRVEGYRRRFFHPLPLCERVCAKRRGEGACDQPSLKEHALGHSPEVFSCLPTQSGGGR